MKHALLFSCAFLLLTTNLLAITFDERVDAQRAIERVYYNHRIWPKENPGPKPPLEAILPETALRAKVEDYLRKSNALEVYWQRPITPLQLQAEMDRMARETKQPAMLRELFGALDNAPQLIAECLARPILADRLIYNMYAGDERFHGALRRQVESELAITNTVEAMRALSGSYHESVWKKSDAGAQHTAAENVNGSILLDAQEWQDWTARLQQGLPGLPLMRISRLQEDADRYYVAAILQKDNSTLRLATVTWEKQSFQQWWKNTEYRRQAEVAVPSFAYALPAPPPDSAPTNDTWSPTDTGPPAGRIFHTAVWTGTEMIVWGGHSFANYVNNGGRYNPATNTWNATRVSGAPTGRESHTAIWTGTEMIVWGGRWNDGTDHYENTGGRYNPSADTWAATSITGAPTARILHSAIWTGTYMIVWGGLGGSNTGARYNPSTDTWSDTTAANAPLARQGHSAIWTDTYMIVWGGYNGTYLATGGRYNPSTDTWLAGGLSTAGAPPGREFHTAIWTGTEMIVWGGLTATELNTGGRYNPSTNTWSATTVTNAPGARRAHTTIWTGNEMIVWGGYWYDGANHYENTGGRYNPSTDTWTAGGTITNGAPSARGWHAAVWTGSEMIVWGGQDGQSWFDSGGRYDPSTDTWDAAGTGANPAPGPRRFHTAVWTGTEMIVWGGYDGLSYLLTGGRYNPSTNTWAAGGTNTLSTPAGRFMHTAVWTGTEMIVWGGLSASGTGLLNTGGRYNPSTDTWTAGGTSTINAPVPRYAHIAVWTGTEMVVWGGTDLVSYMNTGGRYNPSTNSWLAGGTSTTNAPSGRAAHTSVWTGTEMIVWGGYDGSSLNTGGRYDPSTDTWTAGGTDTTIAPVSRRAHAAVWTDTEMIIWGGYDGVSYLNTGGRYNPSTNTWTVGGVSTFNGPSGRSGHKVVWTGTEMIVWGGTDGAANLNTGGRYNPSTDAWASGGTSTTNAPSGRAAHTSVWTGTQMIVWGGFDGVGYLNTGGIYYTCDTPVITTQPVSQTISSGQAANLSVVASGTAPLAYQWYQGVSGDTSTPVGTNSSSYTTPPLTGTTSYWVRVSNACGTGDSVTATITVGAPCLFCDDFEDGVLDWSYLKPAWSEAGGYLVATPKRKAIAIADTVFPAGCRVCSVEAEMQTAGGVGNKMWVLGWYQDKNNTMELLIKEENDKIILRQRAGGRIVKKQAATHITIAPNINYKFKIAFDGTQFDVSMNDAHLMTFLPAGTVPTGTVGFQVKNTIGTFDSINVQ